VLPYHILGMILEAYSSDATWSWRRLRGRPSYYIVSSHVWRLGGSNPSRFTYFWHAYPFILWSAPLLEYFIHLLECVDLSITHLEEAFPLLELSHCLEVVHVALVHHILLFV
jgi:hypothetical protein